MTAQHRIERRDAFHVVGLREHFTPPHVEGIPKLWDRAVGRFDEIPNRAGTECYGVCVCPPETGPEAGPAPRPFDYIACVRVASLERVPEGLAGTTVPAGTYAVFTHRGPIGGIVATVRKVWGEWIPAAGLRPTGAPEFELYDERFRGEEPDSQVEIWIPVAAGD